MSSIAALYVMTQEPATAVTIAGASVAQLWEDPRFADQETGAMLSLVRDLHHKGIAHPTGSPTLMMLGSADAFRHELRLWFQTTRLPLDVNTAIRALLGRTHAADEHRALCFLATEWKIATH